MIGFSLSLRMANTSSSDFLEYHESYQDFRLIPFLAAMEIPVSIAYPIVKKVFDDSELKPGLRNAVELASADDSLLELLDRLLNAVYPDCLCIVDNNGEPESEVHCYVYDVDYKKEWLKKLKKILDKPEEAVFHLEDRDKALQLVSRWRLQH